MSANYTLTGNFQQLTGVSDATGQLIIQLCNYGTQQPRASGVIITTGPQTVTCSAGAFSQLLWGNDQITPSGTFYDVRILTSKGQLVSELPYQFTGGGSNDLSTLSPLASTPPTPVSNYALINSPAFTGTPTAPTASNGTNTTQLATTAFVLANGGGGTVTSVFGRTGVVVAATNDYAFSQVSGSVAASQLPNPSASTLGGVESLASVASKWINTISTSGVPSATQPAFTDISGSVSAAQLPNPSASTLGGIESIAAVSHKYISSISTSGVPALTQPDYSDLTGTPTASLGGILSCGYDLNSIVSGDISQAAPSTSANNVHTFQFTLDLSLTINKIVYAVTTLSASDKWAFGIYSSDGNTKLVDTGVISPTATGTAFSITIGAVTLSPGVYIFVQTGSGTTAATNYFIANTAVITPMVNQNRARWGLAANASAAGVLPSTLGAISTATIRSPMLVLFEN